MTFPSAGGTCCGVLYRPEASAGGPLPVVVVAHGFSGTRLMYDRKARRLVEAGVAVVDFDPRFIGTSPGEPRQRMNVFEWLEDLKAAVAHARGQPDLDPNAVGLYGSSLGGGLAFAVAAEDDRIRTIALDAPMLDGSRTTPAPMRSRPVLMAAIARDVWGRRRGRAPVVVPVCGDVGSGAVMQHDLEGFWQAFGEVDGIEWVEPRRVARHPETGEWRNEATALELLSSARFRPVRRAGAIRCRVLAHLSEDDHIVPYKATQKALTRIPGVDLRTMRGGHFAPFYGDGYETATAAQIEFFADHMRNSSAS